MKFVVQETSPDVFAEVRFGSTIVVDDVQHPWQVADLWPAADLEAIGVFLVEPAEAPPPGSVVKGYSFARIGGAVVQLLDVELPSANTLHMKASARQIRLAMNELGLRDDIEEYVASQSIDVRDSWQFTTEFDTAHPFIIGAKEQLNKSDAELVALFSLAQTYT